LLDRINNNRSDTTIDESIEDEFRIA